MLCLRVASDLRGSKAPSQDRGTQAPKAAVILMKTKSGFVPTRPIKGVAFWMAARMDKSHDHAIFKFRK